MSKSTEKALDVITAVLLGIAAAAGLAHWAGGLV